MLHLCDIILEAEPDQQLMRVGGVTDTLPGLQLWPEDGVVWEEAFVNSILKLLYPVV